MNYKTLLCCFILLLLGTTSIKAQREINFQYDSSGNRTERTIYLPSGNSSNSTLLDRELKFEEDKLGQREIKIYPNPTKGQLKVEISGTEFGTKDFISIYTLSGSLIKRISPLQTVNIVDLTTQVSGMYLMVISLGSESLKWKIVKQ